MSGTVPPPAPTGVAGGRPPLSHAAKGGIVVAGAAVLAGLYLMSGPAPRPSRGDDVGGTPGAAGVIRRIEVPALPPEPPAAQPVSLPVPASGAPFQPRGRGRDVARRSEPIMAWEERDTPLGGAATAVSGQRDEGAGQDDDLGVRLRASRTETTRARRLRNPDLTITAGTVVGCTPQQPLNTQLPGFLSCVVPMEVRGTTGRVVLLDRGTRIVGQMQRQMQHGQNRAFILWTRAETPDGVVVDLGSPGTDALGQNGLDVEVHTNFWQRFGGAIMLSFIDAGLQAAALGASSALSQPGQGGQSVNLFQMQSGGSNAAARAIDATVAIPPYGFRPHGEPAAVFVARDLDFSGVYALRTTR